MLEHWAVRGVDRVSEGSVKGRVKLVEGRPLDRNAVEQARACDRFAVQARGLLRLAGQGAGAAPGRRQGPGRVRRRTRAAGLHQPGRRRRQRRFSDKAVVEHMSTRPEGFWWFQKGEYDEDKVEEDVREKLPAWYADHGFVDFQVTDDSLVADSTGGQGDPAPHGRRGPAVLGGDVRHRGEPAVLERRADGVLSVRPGWTATAPPLGRQPFNRSRVGGGHREGAEPVRQQRLHLRPGGAARRSGARRPTGNAGRRPAAGPSGKARPRRSTRSRSWGTT